MDLEESEMYALTQNLLSLSAVEQADVPAHFESILSEMMAGAHFYTSGLKTAVMTNRGTQPGRSLADLTYNLVMTLKLKRIRARLLNMGLVTSVEWSGHRCFLEKQECCPTLDDAFDATFVDDTVIFLATCS